MEFGMQDEEARRLIDEYNAREEGRAAESGTLGDRVDNITARLETIFSGPGRAAAVNEVLTALKHPEYLAGIMAESPGLGEIEAVTRWSIRRGRLWEAA
jgi:hypothetical protein